MALIFKQPSLAQKFNEHLLEFKTLFLLIQVVQPDVLLHNHCARRPLCGCLSRASLYSQFNAGLSAIERTTSIAV
jgi:hypothetical protein